MTSKASTTNPPWHDAWHLWRVVIPRNSITGKLVWGQVWRRRDRGRWIYKKVVEYIDGEPAGSAATDDTMTFPQSSFQIVCVDCDAVGIAIDYPEDAPASTKIKCRQCGGPRGAWETYASSLCLIGTIFSMYEGLLGLG